MIEEWRANSAMQSQSWQRAGFDALPPLDELWGERDLLHVNTLHADRIIEAGELTTGQTHTTGTLIMP